MSRVGGVSPKNAAENARRERAISEKSGRRVRLTGSDKKKLRDLGVVLLITAALAIPYYLTVDNEVMWGMYLYYTAAGVTGIVFAVLNIAASHMIGDPRAEAIMKARRVMLFIFMPLLLIVLWDVTMLFLGDYIKSIVGL
jgi:hypothetical protein